MALSSTTIATDLVLVMDNGVGASGQVLTKARKYGAVKTTAVNNDIYAVAQIISGLQDQSLVAVQRKDTVEIENF
ncbi:MAG: hypothetical protein CVU90_00195 [Firmicutes bacterium HGW-Firmicutes-15]|nr:MAG: hypothetical protein CVU90_00195 [Firmicutes bacterium HGW-Firmicutes-15]